MTELAKWYTYPLKSWREKNGFTTPEWESYVFAIKVQDVIFSAVAYIIIAYTSWYVGYYHI